MYEDITYEIILKKMLGRIGTNIDKSEGSLIYSALAPEAWELAEAYIAIDTIYNNTFADTAPRQELILRAKERGIEPKNATNAMLKGQFDINIPLESRFSLDDLNYIAIEQTDLGVYKMKCETAGTIGNKKFGVLIPIEYIDGLKSAELTELLIPGIDEEETEAFRSRYFDSFNSMAFGGNRADYIEKIKAINGVGGVKVNRANAENYNVLVQIINSEFGVPSPELISIIQEMIDPLQEGNGAGIAPIGHIVNVQGVTGLNIDLASDFILSTGYVWEDVKDNINAAIDNYFLELVHSWENSEALIVRISQLEAKILEVTAILDITNTRINGSVSNLMLDGNQIPLRGNVSANN